MNSLIDLTPLENITVNLTFDNTSLMKLLVVGIALFVMYFLIRHIFLA